MREAAFIKKNKDSWLELEREIAKSNIANPELIASLFMKTNNDLAYAQTFYPKSKLVEYLNALAANSQNKIYQQVNPKSGLNNFWFLDVPLVMYKYKWYFYFSFLLYFMFVLIGWVSSVYEPEFVRSILGDNYVDMTADNVSKGDPLAVYNNQSNLGDFNSFFNICLRNLLVGLRTIVWGIVAGIGSVLVMMHNGVMVGAFQYMFYDNDNFLLSLRTIWIHGAMELFAMCIEVGAGILIGLSWVFPGALSRKQAFFVKGKAAVKIFLSTIPFTILAAFLEGYVTQFANEMHLILAFAIVLITLCLIAFYYLIYPYIVYKKNNKDVSLIFEEVIHERD